MEPVTDADLAVALDVLQERFSPVKPYPYEWQVQRVEDWAWPGKNRALRVMMDAGKPTIVAALHAPPAATTFHVVGLPPLDRLDLWAKIADYFFARIDGDFPEMDVHEWGYYSVPPRPAERAARSRVRRCECTLPALEGFVLCAGCLAVEERIASPAYRGAVRELYRVGGEQRAALRESLPLRDYLRRSDR